MSIPEWADRQLSLDLLDLIERGEDQQLEFKADFPSSVSDLAKEIAAFATSNAGQILLGISNSGESLGMESASSPSGRDNLVKRVAGICRTIVQPTLTPAVSFAVVDNKIIMAINVPKGRHPVYYSNHKPYVRHLTGARPAEPDEVVELIRSWLPTSGLVDGAEADRELGEFYGQFAGVLIEILIYGDEYEERLINPWLEMWRTQYAYVASELRELATSSIAATETIDTGIYELANLVDHTANLRLTFGSGEDIASSISAATEKARELKTAKIDSQPLSEESLAAIRESPIRSGKKLASLTRRSEQMTNSGRTEELQGEASAVGYDILRLAHYVLDSLKTGLSEELLNIGRKLHLIETRRLYHDGGNSQLQILNEISSCNADLQQCITPLQ